MCAGLVAPLAVPMVNQLQEVMPDVSGMASFVGTNASGKGTGSPPQRTIAERNAKRTLAVTPSKQPGNLPPVGLSRKSATPALKP